MNSFVSSASSSRLLAAVLTCGVRRQDLGGSRRAAPASRPRASPRPRSRRGVPPSRRAAARSAGRSRRASRRRSRDRAEPTKPEIRSRSTGPSAWTPISSPSAKSSLSAVASSITTSFGPGPGALDERQRIEARVAVGDREAEVRRAAVDDRLAVVADQRGRVAVDAPLGLRRPPSQRRAPRRAATRRSVGSVTPLPSQRSNADLPVTTTFEPCADVGEDLVERLSIESVRTNVPLIIATPSTIASAVSAVRSFRPSRPLSAKTRHRRGPATGSLVVQGLERVQAARRAGRA